MKNGDTKLGYALEKMVQNLLNEFVVDGDFRVSAPVGVDTAKRIFGSVLSQGQLNKLSNHDGIVALFSVETERGDSGDIELKGGSVQRRRKLQDEATNIVSKLQKYVGKPVLDVYQGIDQWGNIFGDRSIYVCCFFALDESGYTNIVV